MALRETDLEKAQVGTIRLKLFKVAARVVVTARRVVFHLATSYPFQALYRTALERLAQVPMPGRAGVG
jgi:Transposase DDE domain group 1